MKTFIRLMLVCLLLVAVLPARANLITSVGKETVEEAAKVLVRIAMRNGAEEISESVARRALRAAVEESSQFAKVAKEVGEDALVAFVRSPNTRKFITKYGDEAAETLLVHGKSGGELLEFAPEIAKSIPKLEHTHVRNLQMWRKAGKLSKKAAKDVVEWTLKHPKTALFIGAYSLSPRLRALIDDLFNVAKGISTFTKEYPLTSIIIAICILGFILFFKGEIKAVILFLLLLPLRLLRTLFKKCFPERVAEEEKSGTTSTQQ